MDMFFSNKMIYNQLIDKRNYLSDHFDDQPSTVRALFLVHKHMCEILTELAQCKYEAMKREGGFQQNICAKCPAHISHEKEQLYTAILKDEYAHRTRTGPQ
jgi:hypothetical protein